jgi:hypothetical protein
MPPQLTTARLRPYLQQAKFTDLFVEELGWDRHREGRPLAAGGQAFALDAVAHKRGFVVYRCTPAQQGAFPDHKTRKEIEAQVAKSVREHMIIFTDAAATTQVWQWMRRETGKPLASREFHYRAEKDGSALLQKLQALRFSFEEEDAITLVDVQRRVNASLNVERVTKRFYDEFKKQHAKFRELITGIPDDADCDWYASVMLNRLMFVYFVQRKRFLNGDPEYLRTRMDQCRKEHGQDRFYSFYRFFLLELFHRGLGGKQRTPELTALLGNIPYLNGGMFERHLVEQRYAEIQIPDRAFEQLFDMFDQWNWHLDERPTRDQNEINPDVLGYIFEKYINQKQMGAYYTKEDITEYISKNTIVPFLLDSASKACAIAFVNPHGPTVWDHLRTDPDRYIYEAVRKGVELPLPADIEAGVRDVARRTGWNKPAHDEYKLPTEIWREVVARRQRCEELRTKLQTGDVTAVNDLVTLNLDIRQFAQDVIQFCEGPELLRALWNAVEHVTVLDPTCGSGAFLFAALNILEPLYEACLDRMAAFVGDAERTGAVKPGGALADFRQVLAEVDRHPNRRYFMFKRIILNNLYGVDIMEEAVEICKLRLFLKLAAQVEPDEKKLNLGIEPLPDIDFNIRAGNTLVGYATEAEVRKTFIETPKGQGLLMALGDDSTTFRAFEDKLAVVKAAFDQFHHMQSEGEADGDALAERKRVLQVRLKDLRDTLDVSLAKAYGVDAKKKVPFAAWVKSYQPFHWFVEFYGIVSGGGFDVIVGNPPYVELNALKTYRPLGYGCEECGNLYALVMERCLRLGAAQGLQGYIVPVSSVSTERYASLQRLLATRELHFSSYDDRPSRLFDGLEHIRLTVHIVGHRNEQPAMHSTRYAKWFSDERSTLFDSLVYTASDAALVDETLPKLSSPTEHGIIRKLAAQHRTLNSYYARSAGNSVSYSRKVGYFLQVLDFEPRVLDGEGQRRPPSEFKELKFGEQRHAKLALACLNSNLMYWFVTVFSDCRHLNKREVDAFPVNLAALSQFSSAGKLIALVQSLMADLDRNSEHRVMRFQHDTLTVQCIYPKASKAIIDDIDRVLAAHYGFTDEELDFIVNYDVKYRMGREAETEE